MRAVQEQPWRFAAPELRRIQTVLRPQRDLDLNLPGAALALELAEELRAMRTRLERLERLLGE
jgi:chaperone modulatory protein CbpM